MAPNTGASTAADLLRSLGLSVDGPARWGSSPNARTPGIFAVETSRPTDAAPTDIVAIRGWIERIESLRLDGERPTPTVLDRRLGEFWVPGQRLLYVGRSEKSLAARVKALYATDLGHRRPHGGGHWLKTLREPASLVVWWAETDAGEEYEDALLSAFAAAVPEAVRDALPRPEPLLPWANLDSPSGARRETGITGSLIANDTEAGAEASRSVGQPVARRTLRPAVPRRPAASRAGVVRTGAGARGAARSGKPATRAEVATHLTPDGLTALEAEHALLTTVKRPEVVARVKQARELGDLRENADYEAARNEQAFLEGRIRELERRLRTAVVATGSIDGAIVVGSTVRYEVDGQADELVIVGSTEADPLAGRISQASPVGKALLGRRAGDQVVVKTPAAEARYRILEVR
jgi:transcription elongation factor GreA